MKPRDRHQLHRVARELSGMQSGDVIPDKLFHFHTYLPFHSFVLDHDNDTIKNTTKLSHVLPVNPHFSVLCGFRSQGWKSKSTSN